MKKNKKNYVNQKSKNIDNFCEECKKEEERVIKKLRLMGLKICSYCKIYKTIFLS